jgi:large subunit ribosomal protein L4e
MKVDVFDLNGKSSSKIELPEVFEEQIREDLIKRAFLASLSRSIQPFGADTMAGKRTAAHFHGGRPGRTGVSRYAMIGRDMARAPRLHGKTPLHMTWRARFVPQAVKGREAHPPMIEKVWEEKINKKERKKAIRSAIAATAVKALVLKRGHRISEIEHLPFVVEDGIQKISKTKELVGFLKKIGLEKELERIGTRKIKRGKYKGKVGPLFVVKEDKEISRAVRNLPGADVCKPSNLSVDKLAPGASAGRLVIFTKSAIKDLK